MILPMHGPWQHQQSAKRSIVVNFLSLADVVYLKMFDDIFVLLLCKSKIHDYL